MKILKQVFYILFFFILGELTAFTIHYLIEYIYIPGTIFGMMFLLIALKTKILKLIHVEDAATFLSSNMGFFFIPATVSILEFFDILQPVFIRIILICILSSLISFFVIAYSVKLTLIIQEKISQRRGL